MLVSMSGSSAVVFCVELTQCQTAPSTSSLHVLQGLLTLLYVYNNPVSVPLLDYFFCAFICSSTAVQVTAEILECVNVALV